MKIRISHTVSLTNRAILQKNTFVILQKQPVSYLFNMVLIFFSLQCQHVIFSNCWFQNLRETGTIPVCEMQWFRNTSTYIFGYWSAVLLIRLQTKIHFKLGKEEWSFECWNSQWTPTALCSITKKTSSGLYIIWKTHAFMFYLPRSNDPLNGGIVGEIQEETDVLHASILLEILHTEKESHYNSTTN